ncbi:LysR family transcriptional regulator [Ferruginivarius sediminum]|nr:LysR family transcriptional regulator [Ferruginivarius sediminum]
MVNLELKHFRVFITLGSTLHFSRAAEKLNMAQPQLSRTIKFIEEELGCPLLVRSTRNVALTPAGEVFLEQCRSVINRTEVAINSTRDAADGALGRIDVAYMDFAVNRPLPFILKEFHGQCERVNVNLAHMWTERQKSALLDREVDLGFLIGPFDNPDIETVEVSRDQLMVVLPAHHRLAESTAVKLDQLADERFIFGPMSVWRPYRVMIEQLCLDAGFRPEVVEEPFNSDAIFGLVAANVGITIYPARARRLYPRGLTVRPIADVTQEVTTIAAWHKRNTSKILKSFVSSVASYADRYGRSHSTL